MLFYSYAMPDALNEAKNDLLRYAREQVVLDYWFCQTWITELGLQGREKTGQGILKHLGTMLVLQLTDGAKLELRIKGEVVVEYLECSPDGFQLQVRTSDYGTWILLKPSLTAKRSTGKRRAA